MSQSSGRALGRFNLSHCVQFMGSNPISFIHYSELAQGSDEAAHIVGDCHLGLQRPHRALHAKSVTVSSLVVALCITGQLPSLLSSSLQAKVTSARDKPQPACHIHSGPI